MFERGFNDRLARLLEREDVLETSYHYTGEGQKALSELLKEMEPRIIGMAFRGVPGQIIAVHYGVSRECIAKRLRPYRLSGKKGRPNKPENMQKLTFKVSVDKESGGFVASWDDPVHGGGITTQADSLGALESEIFDAVRCHFDPEEFPVAIRVHFEKDLALTVLKSA